MFLVHLEQTDHVLVEYLGLLVKTGFQYIEAFIDPALRGLDAPI